MDANTRSALMIAAARACLGTRFRHQGRQRRHGLDCLGLVVVAARAAGIALIDSRCYSRQPSPSDFQYYVLANRLVKANKPAPGTVGVFDFGSGPQHVALFTPSGMIHAYAPSRKVVEHGFGAPWTDQLSQVFSLPSS
ncbi:MAG: NlpC/P60 family protein [Pseudomonadota bacterium]